MSNCETCGGTKDLILTVGGGRASTKCAACLNAALGPQGDNFSIRYATRSEMIHSEAMRIMESLNGKDSPLTDHEYELARALTRYFLCYNIAKDAPASTDERFVRVVE